MKKLIVCSIILAAGIILSCNNSDYASKDENKAIKTETAKEEAAPSYDPNRGEGKFKTVDVGNTLNTTMAGAGEKVYSVKCSGCHKLTDEKLVGPGWSGVTRRHKPEWIMNFITNTDAMLDKDPKAQAQLELCLVRMPNQNLADEDARGLLEFMRKNDGIR
ncbi:MAG: cytochrome c [Ferruginibacter sp.]|nr:cytochrome c [Ferruginibacter sp.]